MLDQVTMRDQIGGSTTATPLTGAQFVTSLNEEMHRLYRLSVLLTADREIAEQCFIAAMDDYLEKDGAFIEWAHLEARLGICRHAIRMLAPEPKLNDGWECERLRRTSEASQRDAFSVIFALGQFERFVFVMSVIEGHSDGDCAALLHCTQRDILMARLVAVTSLGNMDPTQEQPPHFYQA